LIEAIRGAQRVARLPDAGVRVLLDGRLADLKVAKNVER
jgi:hypothetical protein